VTDLAIEAEGLVKSFGATKALRGVDLAVPRGTVLGLLGPNGAGKTTAVRILSTLLRPDGGRARVGGHDVVRHPDRTDPRHQRLKRASGIPGEVEAPERVDERRRTDRSAPGVDQGPDEGGEPTPAHRLPVDREHPQRRHRTRPASHLRPTGPRTVRG
jgi:ABC-type multidrug transport system, ATPase component